MPAASTSIQTVSYLYDNGGQFHVIATAWGYLG